MALLETRRAKIAKFFLKRNAEGNAMTGLVTPWVLLLQKLEEKSRKTCQDYEPLRCLVTTATLTSYDVDHATRVCSCCRWHVIEIPYAHALLVLRERGLP